MPREDEQGSKHRTSHVAYTGRRARMLPSDQQQQQEQEAAAHVDPELFAVGDARDGFEPIVVDQARHHQTVGDLCDWPV